MTKNLYFCAVCVTQWGCTEDDLVLKTTDAQVGGRRFEDSMKSVTCCELQPCARACVRADVYNLNQHINETPTKKLSVGSAEFPSISVSTFLLLRF